MIKKVKQILAEEDTRAGVMVIAYGAAVFVLANAIYGWDSTGGIRAVLLGAIDILAMVPAGAGVILIGQGVKHARKKSRWNYAIATPDPEPEENDPRRPKATHCEDCGKPLVESVASYGFDPVTGTPRLVKGQHCPDWTAANGDDPGPCGIRSGPIWSNTKPMIHPNHNHMPESGKRRTDCPGCLWELTQIGTLTKDEADLLAQAFLH